MELPKDWKSLSVRELVLDYQRPAFKARDNKTVTKIAEEMSRRLAANGLVQIVYGWMSVGKVDRGLTTGVIKDQPDGVPIIAYVKGEKDIYDGKARAVGKGRSYESFIKWLESPDEGKRNSS